MNCDTLKRLHNLIPYCKAHEHALPYTDDPTVRPIGMPYFLPHCITYLYPNARM